jgi:predicted amidohydrolase
MKSKLRVAGCQFAVAGDIESNRRQVLAQIDDAAAAGARVVQFPEAALTGYAGVDVPDFGKLDWLALRRATDDICQRAAARKVWILLGSAHPLSAQHRPHNSVYVISDTGSVIDRYDKRFCTGNDGDAPEMDLKYYSPGDHATIFDIDGHRCGVLICYDYRFPELYRDLKRRGVEVVFQSFHNARRDSKTFRQRNIWKQIVPATMMCHAATNHFWILAVNSSAKYSMWANFFVRPDGRIAGRLELHEPGILIGDIDPGLEVWDAPAPWRDRAMQGILHSGELVDDPRSRDRTAY